MGGRRNRNSGIGWIGVCRFRLPRGSKVLVLIRLIDPGVELVCLAVVGETIAQLALTLLLHGTFEMFQCALGLVLGRRREFVVVDAANLQAIDALLCRGRAATGL